MGTRLELQTILEKLLGSRNVYFQPPETVKLQYPCIVYNRNDIEQIYAGDKTYHLKDRYSVTVVDRNPDSEVPHKVAQLPLCSYDRHYISDNLNHDVFNIYY